MNTNEAASIILETAGACLESLGRAHRLLARKGVTPTEAAPLLEDLDRIASAMPANVIEMRRVVAILLNKEADAAQAKIV